MTNSASIQNFFIHFDLENNQHEIPIDQSITTEQSIKIIIEELNKNLFNGNLEIKVFIYADEPWSLIKKFWAYVILPVWTFILGNMFPDISNWIIMWLWDGREVKEYIRDWTIEIKELVTWFFEKESSELEKIWISHLTYYKAFEAKNKFYGACINNKNVKAVWFDKTNDFPVNRNDFLSRISDLSIEKLWLQPIDKYHKLTVISWINTPEDKRLVWQFKDRKVKKKFSAYMKDDDFYNFFLSNQIYLVNIVAKVRYYPEITENGEIKFERREIIQVFEYNWESFSEFPKDAEITTAPLEGIDVNWKEIFIENKEQDTSIKEKETVQQLSLNFK